jgi:hypothetical protein
MYYSRNHNRALIPFAVFVLMLSAGFRLSAQETVAITLPSSMYFSVVNVTTNTVASTNPSLIRFEQANLTSGRSLRISVRVTAPNLTPPSGQSIPATNLSWTTAGAFGGAGFSGTVNSSSFTTVYQSNPSPSFGGVDLNWTLSSPGIFLRAGVHAINLEWKIESVP